MPVSESILNRYAINGDTPIPDAGPYDEIGTLGLGAVQGLVHKAYTAELYWPGVAHEYSRMWRSDPEITITRNVWGAWAGQLQPKWQLPEIRDMSGQLMPASVADERALWFVSSVMDDVPVGLGGLLADSITKVPFFGWGLWEAPLGLRQQGWSMGEWES